MRFVRQATVAAIAALIAIGLADTASATLIGTNGKIAFTSNRDGNNEIYAMNADGTGQVNLTNNAADDREPAWSPDGARIAFATTRHGDWEIYVMNADGSGLARLTTNTWLDSDPTWSPDGSKIAFTTNRNGPDFDIYVMSSNGTGQTFLDADFPSDHQPSWLADGRIAFISDRTGSNEPWIMDGDGTDQAALDENFFDDQTPNGSPDSSLIAFATSANDQGNSYDIWTITTDAQANYTSLPTPVGPDDIQPAWSPDGTRIAFASERDGNFEIYTMNPNGSGQTRRTTNGSARDTQPDWQPLTLMYPRPVAATPKKDALVPAMRACGAPNQQHEAPQAVGSCYPAVPASEWLTVGTPELNGQPVKFSGHTAMTVQPGSPATPGDQADVALTAQLNDVRQKSSLADYTGQLGVRLTLRITDRRNAPALGNVRPGTLPVQQFSFAMPCTATGDTTVGSTCTVSTTADAVMPNVVAEGKRAIWEVAGTEVYDGGADGVFATTPNTLFAVAGVFIP
jgi:Tol biopolymer transport system component